MENRELGGSGIAIVPLVFGGNVFGWTADRARSFELLDHFIGRDFNAVDTADVYSSWAPGLSGSESETVIGEWLAERKRRDDIVLMTKSACGKTARACRPPTSMPHWRIRSGASTPITSTSISRMPMMAQ